MSYPTSPGFQSASLSTREAVQMSETGSLRTQARSLNAQRWEIEANHPPMTRAEAAPIMAFIASQRGRTNSFTVLLPELSDAAGTASGVARVNNTLGYSAGATGIGMDGITGNLKAGDMIKFDGHSKVYMLTSDRDGNGTMNITPPLRQAVSNDEIITYDAVPFTVRFADNVHRFSFSTSVLARISVDFIEVV